MVNRSTWDTSHPHTRFHRDGSRHALMTTGKRKLLRVFGTVSLKTFVRSMPAWFRRPRIRLPPSRIFTALPHKPKLTDLLWGSFKALLIQDITRRVRRPTLKSKTQHARF